MIFGEIAVYSYFCLFSVFANMYLLNVPPTIDFDPLIYNLNQQSINQGLMMIKWKWHIAIIINKLSSYLFSWSERGLGLQLNEHRNWTFKRIESELDRTQLLSDNSSLPALSFFKKNVGLISFTA